MKRVLFLLFVGVFVLAGCGNTGSGELEKLADTFNKRASSEGIPELLVDEFGEIEEYEDDFWRELYESDKYNISADYENGKKLIGYSVTISATEPFENLEGDGYKASTLFARALGLNVGEYANNFKTALKKDIHTYTDKDYKITFVNIGWDSSIPTSIIIRFEKE